MIAAVGRQDDIDENFSMTANKAKIGSPLGVKSWMKDYRGGCWRYRNDKWLCEVRFQKRGSEGLDKQAGAISTALQQ